MVSIKELERKIAFERDVIAREREKRMKLDASRMKAQANLKKKAELKSQLFALRNRKLVQASKTAGKVGKSFGRGLINLAKKAAKQTNTILDNIEENQRRQKMAEKAQMKSMRKLKRLKKQKSSVKKRKGRRK